MSNRNTLNASSMSGSAGLAESGLFTTEPTPAEKEVQKRHIELNNYIQVVDQKVKRKVEVNEEEILQAYKKHLYNVRKDMQDLKDQTTKAAKDESTISEKVEMLEKQVALFREEALRLFQKVVEKDKIIEKMTLQQSETSKENEHLTETTKRLMQQNKHLQIQL